MMETTRLLLPFTHGVHKETLEHAVWLAKSYQAVLVSLALLHVRGECSSKGARLEHIQQSKDFLEVIKHKAVRHSVPVERFEVCTNDTVQSINVLVHELKCDGILLFVNGDKAVLLQAREIQQLMKSSVCKLYVVYTPLEERKTASHELFSLFSRLFGPKETSEQNELLALMDELRMEHAGLVSSAKKEISEVS